MGSLADRYDRIVPRADLPAQPRQRSGSPRTKPAAQRRRDLLDAGLAVFVEKGVAAATLDHVTQRAGVAKGTFYLHFDSKEHLLAALQTDFEQRLVERIDARVADAGESWAARLDTWVDAALADYPADRALHDVLFHHPVLPGDTKGVHAERDLASSLTELIDGGIEAGAFSTADPPLTAMLLCSAMHRAFDRIWHQDVPYETERLSAAVRELFRRALVVEPAVRSAQRRTP
ncbi:TetR family transcriptional regulator [Pseudonocardia cypriaca]|uniref:TetR family transcriptional regulator n=1 Tax=Pseudonocardia cypriaca TaxID=882449 RepID=A0A543FVK0_9PSEU|nr:TetR family transcriptional regulator [Pseudonocardia cypriaca]